MRDFHNLKVWVKAHQLVIAVYKASADYPKNEIFSLTNQSRRAAVSIASNIAEGCGRGTEPEFAHFLQIAMGSASEVQYQLLLSRDLGFLNQATFQQLEGDVIEIKKMLTSLIQKLKAES